MLLSEEDLASRLTVFLSERQAVLFSGAGVGRRAGLPDWDEYVQELATIVEPYELETADLMRKRVAAGLYGEAVRLFKACPRMPLGEQMRKLAAPFAAGRGHPDRLRVLLALPFSAVVTTNFDRTQHDASSQVTDRAPQVAELGDPSLKEAIYTWSTFYIARIHGRSEVPTTMVVTDEDFSRVSSDAVYCDFLHHILTRHRCLFIGFSFLDPAINVVLQFYSQRVGPTFPKLHLAVLPKSASRALLERLPALNIDVVQYEDDREHSSLWRALRKSLTALSGVPARPGPSRPQPHELAKKMLAVAFARHRLGSELDPLREVVVDGLVLGVLSEKGDSQRAQISGNLKAAVGLRQEESDAIVAESLKRLISRGWISLSGDRVRRRIVLRDDLGEAFQQLVTGVKERLLVRYGQEMTRRDERGLVKVLEGLVLLRGWELGAEFSTGHSLDYYSIERALDTLFSEHSSRFQVFKAEKVRFATRDLLRQPTEKESTILNRLARVAFGVELSLQRGVSILTKRSLLPERVYLDASVLLPAIAVGHPLRSAYLGAISAITRAAESSNTRCYILVLEGFLNEVVSHKQKAVTMVAETGLEQPEALGRFIDFVGAQNTNVFVGAYASFLRREGAAIRATMTFKSYLDRYAPYNTEERLMTFLEQHNVAAVSRREVGKEIEGTRELFRVALQSAYEEEAAPFSVRKAAVLIEHEARQLALLATEMERGDRSIFVTADSGLRRLIRGEVLATVAESVLSQVAFLQLVDLFAGLGVGQEDSLARLLWAVEAGDGKRVLRGYLIDRGLREYDAALAMRLPKLAERIAAGISEDESKRIGQFERVRDARGAAEALKLLDRYEEEFFEGMAAEIRSLSAKQPSGDEGE